MNLIRIFTAMIGLLAIISLTSCITIYPPGQSSPGETLPEPLIGEWQMTRLNINPPVPLPDILLNQFISDKATWKIIRQSGQLVISYDGNDAWYKTMIGLQINKRPIAITENQGKTSCTFTGGGNINMDKLPGLLSVISPQKMDQISISFDDKIQINLAATNKLVATINVTVNGKYYGETEFGGTMKWKTLQQNNNITYEGVRK
jgi:hypothetical protein